MKNLILYCTIFFLTTLSAKAQTIDCLIVKEGEKYLINQGKNCDTQYSPASTFKIALALIGYESGILKDENHPIFKAKETPKYLPKYWSGEKTPFAWMKYSIVWYSQMITTKLGMKNFQKYVDQLDYGNKNLSGNALLNDGLTQSWLSSSLLISPSEQINFIEKLAANKLPFSQESQIKTKILLQLFEESHLSDGWNLHGKTGTDVDKNTSERRGYFVGFGTKENRIISFVIHISGEKDSKIGGIYAKKIALDKMGKVLGF